MASPGHSSPLSESRSISTSSSVGASDAEIPPEAVPSSPSPSPTMRAPSFRAFRGAAPSGSEEPAEPEDAAPSAAAEVAPGDAEKAHHDVEETTEAPLSLRPSRKRNAPVRFGSEPRKSLSKSLEERITGFRRGPNYDPDHVLRNKRSILTDIELVELLSQGLAWDSLTPAEQAELISLLPDHVKEPEAAADMGGMNPVQGQLMLNEHFQNAVATWQADLKDGMKEEKWLKEAAEAMEERKKGLWQGTSKIAQNEKGEEMTEKDNDIEE